ncbi:hypothetical protein NC653_015133 [Populus alba x Populus x berolinensis]|uniref:Uncharacterized protein n=1 Tax=Populus alba x Populus x berolinensis TaxID=444605 RepID=A0AAD6W584_9ROSI|nr:hypothetical protein NC653_015133 [Populus alba x Populus x berolinensis]
MTEGWDILVVQESARFEEIEEGVRGKEICELLSRIKRSRRRGGGGGDRSVHGKNKGRWRRGLQKEYASVMKYGYEIEDGEGFLRVRVAAGSCKTSSSDFESMLTKIDSVFLYLERPRSGQASLNFTGGRVGGFEAASPSFVDCFSHKKEKSSGPKDSASKIVRNLLQVLFREDFEIGDRRSFVIWV